VAVDEACNETAVGDSGESGVVRQRLESCNPLVASPKSLNMEALGVVSAAAITDSCIIREGVLYWAGCMHVIISGRGEETLS
jgi:hypothetical protein